VHPPDRREPGQWHLPLQVCIVHTYIIMYVDRYAKGVKSGDKLVLQPVFSGGFEVSGLHVARSHGWNLKSHLVGDQRES